MGLRAIRVLSRGGPKRSRLGWNPSQCDGRHNAGAIQSSVGHADHRPHPHEFSDAGPCASLICLGAKPTRALIMATPTSRCICAAVALAMGSLTAISTAAAEDYPVRPVRIIIGFGPGASGDIAARVLAQKFSTLFGQQFVVENRTGAGSNIATNYVAHAPKDGYTLLQGTVANTINPAITPNLTYDFVRDFVPISLFTTLPNILVVHPAVEARS